MREAGWLVVYLVVTFVGGGLLAPWVWWLGQFLMESHPSEGMRWLTQHPFHRYTHRCILLMAIAGLVPLARALGCRRWSDLGWTLGAGAGREVMRGAGLALFMGMLVMGTETLAGLRDWRTPDGAGMLGRILAGALATALVVGVLEETLFRGVLCGGLRRRAGWWTAILISSVVYSVVHFLQRPRAPGEIDWMTGLALVGRMVDFTQAGASAIPRGMLLLTAGCLLAWMYLRTGRLWFPLGLHAGWVFVIKAGGSLSEMVPVQDSKGSDMGPIISGAIAAVVLLVTFGWILGHGLQGRRKETVGM